MDLPFSLKMTPSSLKIPGLDYFILNPIFQAGTATGAADVWGATNGSTAAYGATAGAYSSYAGGDYAGTTPFSGSYP